MATDATGTPTALGIPKYDVNVDAPSGLGFNAAMDAIDSIITTQVGNGILKTLVSSTGDMIYASSADTPARLPIGSSGDILTVSGGIPAWAAGGAALPSGVIVPYGVAAAPSGWLLCDGTAVSRATYSALFALISTTYGVGDGSTTFNVPDLRGRVVAGYAASGGHADVAALGNNDGVAAANRRPKHNHTATIGGNALANVHPGDQGATGGHVDGVGFPNNAAGAVVIGPSGTNPVDAAAYIVLNYIIKA